MFRMGQIQTFGTFLFNCFSCCGFCSCDPVWSVAYSVILFIIISENGFTDFGTFWASGLVFHTRIFRISSLKLIFYSLWSLKQTLCLFSSSYLLASSSDICIWFFCRARICSSSWKFASWSCLFFIKIASASLPVNIVTPSNSKNWFFIFNLQRAYQLANSKIQY